MTAIYARQSVEKRDSISIESQLEACRRKLPPEEAVRLYTDRGFSGKNTNRPRLLELMADMEQGLVERLVVYRIDRISRSLLDFLRLQELFRRHDVEFLSCQEDFDTSTASGKMMMNLLMMFAEMERESIQKRIMDNYYARGEKGLYLGGYAPFGYRKVAAVRLGKRTSAFEVVAGEADIVRELYRGYARQGMSLAALARQLNEEGIATRRGGPWNAQGVSRALRNPVYVRADADVYAFLRERGATIHSPLEDFIGENGCYVYGNARSRRGEKFRRLDTDHVVLAPHPGIVEAGLWLEAQRARGKAAVSPHTPASRSWLRGMVYCLHCGRRLTLKAYGGGLCYFTCPGRKQGSCGSRRMLRADLLEAVAEGPILEELAGLVLTGSPEPVADRQLERQKIRSRQLAEEIRTLLARLGQVPEAAVGLVGEELARLDRKKRQLDEAIEARLAAAAPREAATGPAVAELWPSLPTAGKAAVAGALLHRVEAGDDHIHIRL